MDKLLDTLNQYLQQAHGVITKYGPAVWDSTLELVRANAIFNLVTLTIITVIVVIGARKILPAAYRKVNDSDFDNPGWIVLAVVGTVGEIAGVIIVLIGWLCSFPYWLGLFSPSLAILYKVAEKAGLL